MKNFSPDFFNALLVFKKLLVCKKLLASRSLVAALSLLLSAGLSAQPYVPLNSSDVVVNLPAAVVSLSRQIRDAESARTSADPRLLLNNVAEAYRLAASSQEARAYGHVMSLLEQWPADVEKPLALHTIHAAVLQHNHAFDEALSELDVVLATNPTDLQAHMIRAQIGLVTGDYALTQQSCDALRAQVSTAVHLNCQAQLEGVSGRAQQALSTVMAELASNTRLVGAERIELQITAAVLAHRLGQADVAERFYVLALLQSPQHFYTLVHYGNFLLEQNRPRDLIRLAETIPAELRTTEVNILLAEALLAMGDTQAEILLKKLESDFELALLRPDALPHKEHARYALNIRQDPALALRAALNNWSEQKEPSDALLLAKAAAAAADQRVLTDLHQWIRDKGTESQQLDAVFAEQGLLL